MRKRARAMLATISCIIFHITLPLTFKIFVVHFSNAFFPVKESFPKGSSLCENVPLHVVFHLRGD